MQISVGDSRFLAIFLTALFSFCIIVANIARVWFAVNDDPEGAEGNGGRVQEGPEAVGETPAEGRES